MSKIEFNTVDRATTCWAKFMRIFDERIEDLRMLNDQSQPEHMTNILRGRIEALKDLKKLNEPTPKMVKGELD